ncbi:hypothetical protein MICRO8M_80068 [Microbacterium sp. 8M]|nr:hypothetical protein MICRO8M_80068 [Microbacterium sp. 8M]
MAVGRAHRFLVLRLRSGGAVGRDPRAARAAARLLLAARAGADRPDPLAHLDLLQRQRLRPAAQAGGARGRGLRRGRHHPRRPRDPRSLTAAARGDCLLRCRLSSR